MAIPIQFQFYSYSKFNSNDANSNSIPILQLELAINSNSWAELTPALTPGDLFLANKRVGTNIDCYLQQWICGCWRYLNWKTQFSIRINWAEIELQDNLTWVCRIKVLWMMGESWEAIPYKTAIMGPRRCTASWNIVHDRMLIIIIDRLHHFSVGRYFWTEVTAVQRFYCIWVFV